MELQKALESSEAKEIREENNALGEQKASDRAFVVEYNEKAQFVNNHASKVEELKKQLEISDV
jgi:hypothetical protein